VVILFDFGGTLDADGTRWSIRFHAAYLAAGGSLPFPAFEARFRESDRQLAAAPRIQDLGFRATLELQSALLSRLLAQAGERVDPAVLAEPVHAAALSVIERNRPVLADLATRSRLGVVSNFTGNLERCLAEVGLLELFDIVADSGAVGIAKPDPRLFEVALAGLGATPASAWMVGDNPAADLVPAGALGMKTCWLTVPGDHRPLPAGIPTARITALPQLPSALDLPCTV
jgi:HAD superfamily hydrolase (TIGR01509 family)